MRCSGSCRRATTARLSFARRGSPPHSRSPRAEAACPAAHTRPLLTPRCPPLCVGVRSVLCSGAGGGSGLPDELLPALVLEASSIAWNKRCALAYLHERLTRVKALWWGTAGVLTAEDGGSAAAEMREGMAPHELRFFDAYNGLIAAYSERAGVEVSQDPTPPRSVWVVVQVLRTVEPILGSDGNPIRLTAGSRKRMKRVDAENLLRQHIVRLAD